MSFEIRKNMQTNIRENYGSAQIHNIYGQICGKYTDNYGTYTEYGKYTENYRNIRNIHRNTEQFWNIRKYTENTKYITILNHKHLKKHETYITIRNNTKIYQKYKHNEHMRKHTNIYGNNTEIYRCLYIVLYLLLHFTSDFCPNIDYLMICWVYVFWAP
jgi:hypothetical protein